jgi:hypothetical protein
LISRDDSNCERARELADQITKQLKNTAPDFDGPHWASFLRDQRKNTWRLKRGDSECEDVIDKTVQTLDSLTSSDGTSPVQIETPGAGCADPAEKK